MEQGPEHQKSSVSKELHESSTDSQKDSSHFRKRRYSTHSREKGKRKIAPVLSKEGRSNAKKRLKSVLRGDTDETKLSIEKGVQKPTKTNRNVSYVPDYLRFGICRDSLETKTECTKSLEPRVKKECLTQEAVRIRHNSNKKGIFEKDFDGLSSTSRDKVQSSHVEVDEWGAKSVDSELMDSRQKQNERTPEKSKQEMVVPSAPVKNTDHRAYCGSSQVRHVCSYCCKVFKSNGKLNSHVYSHTGERPYDCSHCGKAFSSKFKLVRHLLIHSEVRKFVCQICSRTFLRNDHLKNHYKIHDPMKKIYKCEKENCDKEYSSSLSFKKHMAYHRVEDGELKCSLCSVKYETKEEVLFHLKSHSGSRLFKSHTDKKFKCEFCERLFLTRKDVTRHLVVHTGERDFLCQFCPQRFGRKDHLVRHIRKSHHKPAKLNTKKSVEHKKTSTVVREEEATPPSVGEPPPPPCAPSPQPSPPAATPEVVADLENTTHIVITVDSSSKRDSSSRRKKSFQKLEESVPSKKQVPLGKSKKESSRAATQIYLQNIPNVFIIPNNSIILLRNQVVSKNVKESAPAQKEATTATAVDLAEMDNLGEGEASEQEFNFTPNFNLDAFQTPQLSTAFSDTTNFTDLGDFSQSYQGDEPFDLINSLKKTDSTFAMIPEMDCLKRGKAASKNGDEAPSRKVGVVRPVSKITSQCDLVKDIFEESNENLILSESLLNELKSAELTEFCENNFSIKEESVLNSMLSPPAADPEGADLLRSLLTSSSDALSPLPGFSQIFQNSNPNSG